MKVDAYNNEINAKIAKMRKYLKELGFLAGLKITDIAHILGYTRATIYKMTYYGMSKPQYYALRYIFEKSNDYFDDDALKIAITKLIDEWPIDLSFEDNYICKGIAMAKAFSSVNNVKQYSKVRQVAVDYILDEMIEKGEEKSV